MDPEKFTMYPITIPSVDDSVIIPEVLSLDELDELIEAMAMSNETIRAENDLLETYLANTDSQLIVSIFSTFNTPL